MPGAMHEQTLELLEQSDGTKVDRSTLNASDSSLGQLYTAVFRQELCVAITALLSDSGQVTYLLTMGEVSIGSDPPGIEHEVSYLFDEASGPDQVLIQMNGFLEY